MARNKKRHPEHQNHERWLITYADLITLLLIFFVVMYAMSKIDTDKYAVLAQSLNFQYDKAETLLPRNDGIVGSAHISRTDEDKKNEQAEKDRKDRDIREGQLQDLLEKIQQYIQQQNLQAQVFIANTPRGITVTLNDLFIFDLGRADLNLEAYPILNQLASFFPALDSTISIEGHTDNLPLATGSLFKDNWRLSSERSLSVLRYFIDTTGLDPKKFMSSALADTKPIANNDTPENRSKNRRVEIIVLR